MESPIPDSRSLDAWILALPSSPIPDSWTLESQILDSRILDPWLLDSWLLDQGRADPCLPGRGPLGHCH
jgi:hypothetical protein